MTRLFGGRGGSEKEKWRGEPSLEETERAPRKKHRGKDAAYSMLNLLLAGCRALGFQREGATGISMHLLVVEGKEKGGEGGLSSRSLPPRRGDLKRGRPLVARLSKKRGKRGSSLHLTEE